MIVVASTREAAAAVSRIAAEVALATKEHRKVTDRVVTGTTIVDQGQIAADMVTSAMKAAMVVVAATGEVEMTGVEMVTAKEEEITTAAAAKETVSIDTAAVVVVVLVVEVVAETTVIVIDETNQSMPARRSVWRNVTPVDPS